MRVIGGSQPKMGDGQKGMRPAVLQSIQQNNQKSLSNGAAPNTSIRTNANTRAQNLPTRQQYNRARNATQYGPMGVPTKPSRLILQRPPTTTITPPTKRVQESQHLQKSLPPAKRARQEEASPVVHNVQEDIIEEHCMPGVGAEEEVMNSGDEMDGTEVSSQCHSQGPQEEADAQELLSEEEEEEEEESAEVGKMQNTIKECTSRIVGRNKEIIKLLQNSQPSSQKTPALSQITPLSRKNGPSGPQTEQAGPSTNALEQNNEQPTTAEGPPPQRERMLMPYIPPTFPVVMLHLGQGRYLTGGYVDGDHVIRIQDSFPRKHDDQKRRYIKLNKLQFLDLVSQFSSITGELNRLKSCRQTCVNEDDKKHIGSNIYVSLFRSIEDNLFVDIRQFFIPDEEFAKGECKLIPTKAGISLRATEFEQLTKVAHQMKVYIPALRNMGRCIGTHQFQEDLATCSHCSPNWMLDAFV